MSNYGYLNKKRNRNFEEDFELENILNITDKLIITCHNCKKNITSYPKITLSQQEYKYVYCLSCWLEYYISMNKQSKIKNESYIILNKMNLNLFTSNWTLNEEFLLLNSIEKNGFDNWEDISDSILTKTKEECEAHYNSFYYRAKNCFIPLDNDIIIENKEKEDFNNELEKEKIKNIKLKSGKIPEITNLKNSKLIEKGLEHREKKIKNEKLNFPYNLEGYWHKRKEFEIEYENDIEKEIADIEFFEDDSKEELKIKEEVLSMYNKILDERERRKDFVIERKIIDIKQQNIIENRLNKDEREIYNCLKPFMRFLSENEFQELFDNLIIEKKLKQRINELIDYQNQGLKTYDDIEKKIENTMKMHKKYHKKENTFNNMITETCGIGSNIKNFLINCPDEIQDSKEIEENFLKKVGMSKETFKFIKKQIAQSIIEEKNIHQIEKNNLLEENEIRCLDDTIDYFIQYCPNEKNNNNENKK